MELKLNFNMDNAEFEENPEFEAREILKQIGRQLIHGLTFAKIKDYNGNTIGQWEVIV